MNFQKKEYHISHDREKDDIFNEASMERECNGERVKINKFVSRELEINKFVSRELEINKFVSPLRSKINKFVSPSVSADCEINKFVFRKLKIRKLKFSDAGDIYEHIREREISKWTIHIPYPYELKDAIKFIRKSLYKMRKKKGYNFAIALKETNRMIGGVGLNRIDGKNEHAELGYWIGKKYWGKGLMTEAVRLILEFGFGELKLHRIHANVFEENIASKRVLEKCGFTLEGMEREIEFRYDRWHNVLLYGILAPEYHE
ncbi:MAG: GNAT family N-acetyltransferase [Candidatus Portnoybacteria bacterium]|nr:GNAT family N-acetyltransferase [Candidatus Portnoybacteria bacterium]